MGLYPSDFIYGISIYNFVNDEINILFEKQYETVMSNETIKETIEFYNELKDKNDIKFKVYTECSTTYCHGTCMMWVPITLDIFIQKFKQ